MSNIWLTSDTHFNDQWIFGAKEKDNTLVRPGFNTISEMNEHIIESWNSVVKPEDTVWHLGDVIFGDNKVAWMEKNWPRLNGTKNLVVGNHDKIDMICSYKWFKEVVLWKIDIDRKLMLTHAPVHENVSWIYKRAGEVLVDEKTPLLNVHGHIHSAESPEGRYKCVCVEQTNYIPVNIDELKL